MKEVYHKEVEVVLNEYGVNPGEGLNEDEARRRLEKYGYNQFQRHKRQHAFLIFLTQFKNSIVLLLSVAAVISFLFGDYTEAGAIIAVILINAFIGFILEIQAVRSMEALKKLDLVFAKVIRNGVIKEIESSELVPGDILSLEAGELVTADARLVSNAGLEVNESILTGESLPVAKHTSILIGKVPLPDRVNMVFKGTAVTTGNAIAVVTTTGARTAVGEISDLVDRAEKDEIPLTKKLNQFSHKLIWLTLALVIPFILVALIRGENLYLMMETSIALAVAAIPEGLPIVATISLARGMLKLAKHKVIIKKLAAVETLGETNIIMTDKTGTLTENILKAGSVCVPAKDGSIECFQPDKFSTAPVPLKELNVLMRTAVLCNNATVDENDQALGDPVESALLRLAASYQEGIIEKLRKEWTELEEKPFESAKRIMVTLHGRNSDYLVSAKGATLELLEKCDKIFVDGSFLPFGENEKQTLIKKTSQLSSEGLKVLAFAFHQSDQPEGNFDEAMSFIGLVGFLDPPRKEVPQSIKECHQAGIKVIMVTGDHPETAKAIALKIKLTSDEDEKVLHGKDFELALERDEIEDTIIFSRVSPKQKLDLVNYYQKQGWIVGMTGDGVNDAPALRKADIGVAMGLRGTQVAEEAADMVLQDDSFSSIVRAVRQGRTIFNNIKNFVIYLLSCNLSEILVVAVAAFSNLTLPLLPLQILFLNLVTDVFPALALGMGKSDPSIMKSSPRKPMEPILNRKNWFSISAYSFAITVSVLGAFLYALLYRKYDIEICNNVAFFALAFAQLLHPLNLIAIKDKYFDNEIINNPHLWIAVVFCVMLLISAYFVSPVNQILDLVSLSRTHWFLVLLASIMPLIIIRLLKIVRLVL